MNRLKSEAYKFCGICSNPVHVYGFGSCFHPICYKCSTKLRVLHNEKECPLCKMFLNKVLFTARLAPETRFDLNGFIKDDRNGIWCETPQIWHMFRGLLMHKCTESPCNETYSNFMDLRQHLKKNHEKYFCELCLRNEKVFTDERKTYFYNKLGNNHQKGGNSGGTELWDHLASEHYPCDHPNCSGITSCVFSSEAELKNHKASLHNSEKVSTSRYSPRTIPVANSPPSTPKATSPTSNQPFRTKLLPDGSIKGKGKIMNVSAKFGFIERDDCHGDFFENVFFNNLSYGVDFTQDLTQIFRESERVFFHAKPHTHSNKSRWRAMSVTKLSSPSPHPEMQDLNGETKLDLNRNSIDDNTGERAGNLDKTKLRDQIDDEKLKGVGTIHYNLSPTFGFIIRKGGECTQYRENIYFNIRAYAAGSKKTDVRDLTKELNVNETVNYVLENPELSLHRPPGKEYRAVKVWKCSTSTANSINSSPRSIDLSEPEQATVKSDIQRSNAQFSLMKEFTNNFKLVDPNPTVAPQHAQPRPPPKRIGGLVMMQPAGGFNFPFGNGVRIVIGDKIDMFRHILGVIMGQQGVDSLFDFDSELASNNLTIPDVACIYFSMKKNPKVYSILSKTNLVATPAPIQGRDCFTIPNVKGFNQYAIEDLVAQKVAVNSEDDDLYYIEKSPMYIMLFRDATGKMSELHFHSNLAYY